MGTRRWRILDAGVRIEAADRAGLERLLLTPLELIARIHEAFPLLCPKCGGEMRIIAFITEAVAVRDILAHLGEPTAPPRMAPARGPSLWDVPVAGMGGFDPQAQATPDYEFDQRIAW